MVAQRRQRLRRGHHAAAVGEDADQGRIGLRQPEDDGGPVGLDRPDRAELGLPPGFGHGLRALDVELDRCPVHRLAVMEDGVAPKLHGEGERIVRPRPFGGQLRHVVEVPVDVDQLVAEPGEDHAVEEAAADRRVQHVRIALEADAEVGGQRQRRRQQQRREACEETVRHGTLRCWGQRPPNKTCPTDAPQQCRF